MDAAVAIFPLGQDGMLVRFSDQLSEEANRAALAFRSEIAAAQIEGVTETATSLTSVFLRFRPDMLPRATLEGRVRCALGRKDWLSAALPEGRTLWRMPAAFGGEFGPSLEECADLVGVTSDQAVEEICSTRLRVLALGFAPGQPYLGFLPDQWDIPRQSDVTPEVPQGAVVVAVRQVIPFANAAPTGWRQIGRTAFRCFDTSLETAIPLRPGDEVEFLPVAAPRLRNLLETQADFGGAERQVIG